MTWFPKGEYERALALWPDIADKWGGVPHAEYCRRLDTQIREFRAAGIPISTVAPVRIDDYLAWCEEEDHDQEGELATYGAHLELRGQTIPWPPGRNDRCWCGSGAKYKACCGGETNKGQTRRV